MRFFILPLNLGSLQHCNPADPRDLLRRATEIFRKNVDPENEYLEEEIHNLKRQVLKDFIIRKGGSEEDITGKSKTELRDHAAYLHRKKTEPPPEMEWYEKERAYRIMRPISPRGCLYNTSLGVHIKPLVMAYYGMVG